MLIHFLCMRVSVAVLVATPLDEYCTCSYLACI